MFKAGEAIDRTKKGLSVPPHIAIGTPGRLKDVFLDKENTNISHVKTIVFDEADMAEGYFDDIDSFAL